MTLENGMPLLVERSGQGRCCCLREHWIWLGQFFRSMALCHWYSGVTELGALSGGAALREKGTGRSDGHNVDSNSTGDVRAMTRWSDCVQLIGQ